MEVRDLDGNIVKWTINGKIYQNKSSYHTLARQLLHKIYPTIQILEEVSIPIKRNQTLYLDFYLPLYKWTIEVHGEQHSKFIPHFHKTIQGFAQAKKCDQMKKDWCIINNIKVIELNFNETAEEWEHKLYG